MKLEDVKAEDVELEAVKLEAVDSSLFTRGWGSWMLFTRGCGKREL